MQHAVLTAGFDSGVRRISREIRARACHAVQKDNTRHFQFSVLR